MNLPKLPSAGGNLPDVGKVKVRNLKPKEQLDIKKLMMMKLKKYISSGRLKLEKPKFPKVKFPKLINEGRGHGRSSY